MKFIYDPKANASYAKISNKKIKKTKSITPYMVNVDLDKNYEIVGIELLFPKENTVNYNESIREINI